MAQPLAQRFVTDDMLSAFALRADAIRLAMHFAQIDFEDCRIKPSTESIVAEVRGQSPCPTNIIP